MSKKKKKAKRPLQVLFLPTDDGGCGWYRIRQFHEAFYHLDNVRSVLMTGTEDGKLQRELIESADVVVARPNCYEYIKYIKTEIDPFKPVVFDHDDNTMEILPSSEHYKEFGTEDAWANVKGEIKPVWVTGYTEGFNRYANLQGQMNLLYMLAAADMITTPVEPLLEFYQQFASKNCKFGIIRNAINYDLYPKGEFKPADKKEGEIRIGWQGGVSHMGDWQEVREELNRFMAEYPEVTLYVQGSYYKAQFEEFSERVIRAPWYPFRGYTFKLATSGIDGAIIPLSNDSFNRYKSEIKWVEFNTLGIPVVVKDMLPYSRVAKDGVNCWAYKTPQEFGVKLREMVEDIKKGGKEGQKRVKEAQKFIEQEREIVKEAQKAVEIYKTLLPEKTLRELL